MSTKDINNYTIDAIIINMNYKLLDLENMEENLNNLYFSEKIEETIEETNEEKNKKQLQQQQDFNDIKHLGSAIGHYIETKRTNDDNTIQDIYEGLISQSNIKITQLDSRGSNDSVMSTVIGNLKQTRTDMIEIVTNIYKNSVNKENTERLLYYLMYIKIILEKIKFFCVKLLSDDIKSKFTIIDKIDNICEEWQKLINKTKESLDDNSINIWEPIYNKITEYIEETIYQHTETIKKYDNKEKYIEITTKWANSIITENNEYKRRMLIDIVTQNITRSTKKSL